MYKGLIYRVGDIVDILGDDGLIYYAQIQRFFVTLDSEKYVHIRWLIPKKGVVLSREAEFDPLKFIQGNMLIFLSVMNNQIISFD